MRENYEENKNLESTILNARPPVFWKDKEIVKQQINNWNIKQIKETIYNINNIEMEIKKNYSNSLRLLTLPQDVIKLIETQKISAGHAKILVGLPNASFVATKILEKKLSVRQAETFVKIFKNKKIKSSKTKDTNIIALELSIANIIGINVDIQNNQRNKGKISFEYKDLDQLNRIIDIIKNYY